MKRILLFLALWSGLISSAFAQGGMGPGPGTVHALTGGGSPWTLVASTVLVPAGTQGGTTSAINCTGANLIVVKYNYLFGSAPFPTEPPFFDSSSNVYTGSFESGASGQTSAGIKYVISPSVSSSMTFTWGGPVSPFYGEIIAECWLDTAGTPSYDTPQSSVNQAAGNSSIQPGSKTPSTNNSMIAVVASEGGVDPLATIDGGFTVSQQLAQLAGNYYSISGFYLLQGTAAAVNPTVTFGGTTVDSAVSMVVFKP